ncbi:MAG: branched-chain amino acid ABC transporter permease [Pseudomonadota bacterium]|nr:branched-chain amino acid ABC transporter permease [Pseudomonadota bacterium]
MSKQHIFSRDEGPFWPFLVVYAAAAAWYLLLPGQLHLGTAVLIMIALALSIDLVLGFGGINTLGQAALYGAGAYGAGFFCVYAGVSEPISGVFIGALAGAGVALVTGLIVLRGDHLTVLALSIVVAGVLHELANSFQSLTGGFDGLRGIDMAPLLGLFKFDLWGRTGFIYSAIVLFVMHFFMWRLVASPFGVMMRGIRENPARMDAIGVPVFARRLAIYGIGGAMAGIAGALQTQTSEFVSMEVLSFQLSATALTVVIMGGLGRIYGAFVGAIIYLIFQDYMAKLAPQYWYFWLGLLFLVVAIFMRRGIVEMGRVALRTLFAKREPGQ